MAKLKVRVSLTGLNVTPPNKFKKGKKIIAGISTNIAKLPHLPVAVLVLTDRNNNLAHIAVIRNRNVCLLGLHDFQF